MDDVLSFRLDPSVAASPGFGDSCASSVSDGARATILLLLFFLFFYFFCDACTRSQMSATARLKTFDGVVTVFHAVIRLGVGRLVTR